MILSAGWSASLPQEIPMHRRKFLVDTGIVGAELREYAVALPRFCAPAPHWNLN
jgi:hypothetical protein